MKSLILLSGLGVFALISEIISLRKLIFPVILIGLAAVIGFAVNDWNAEAFHFHNNMMVFDKPGMAFTMLLCAVTILWFWMAKPYIEAETHISDAVALILFALTGAVMMATYGNMVMLFLGIETLSIPMYVLAGSRKNSLNSNESALKYFLMGAFATGFLLFGIALIYGVTGAFHLHSIADYVQANNGNYPPMFYAGITLVGIGMLFKVSGFPFHFWAPDVYTGAPTPVTAFMATVVKTAAFAAFFRLFSWCFGGISGSFMQWTGVLCACTMLIGNLSAIVQDNIKRMLAYSSIAHAGYMLLSILSLGKNGNESVHNALLFYSAAYSLASIISFTVLHQVALASGTESLAGFNGLFKKNRTAAIAMSVALISLAGIPPLAGFFGKYFLFYKALQGGHVYVILFAILASLAGIAYYLRIVIAMFTGEPDASSELQLSSSHKLLLGLCTLGLIILGVMPGLLVNIF